MRREDEMNPVLLATDGSPTAEQATGKAIELAKLLETELVVVTVWSVPYTVTGFAPMPVDGELAKLSEDEAQSIAAKAAALAEEAGVEARTVVLRGFPVEEICLAAERFTPQFLVIGSHGWGLVKRALFGSVSTGVLHRAKSPVLVVRADPVEVMPPTNGRHSVRAA
jgi:nucleotide-binding universal stress UspA family protein